jgi:hypothetical protein
MGAEFGLAAEDMQCRLWQERSVPKSSIGLRLLSLTQLKNCFLSFACVSACKSCGPVRTSPFQALIFLMLVLAQCGGFGWLLFDVLAQNAIERRIQS